MPDYRTLDVDKIDILSFDRNLINCFFRINFRKKVGNISFLFFIILPLIRNCICNVLYLFFALNKGWNLKTKLFFLRRVN